MVILLQFAVIMIDVGFTSRVQKPSRQFLSKILQENPFPFFAIKIHSAGYQRAVKDVKRKMKSEKPPPECKEGMDKR